MKKRLFALLMCLCFMLCIVACGNEGTTSLNSDVETTSSQQSSTNSSKDTTTSTNVSSTSSVNSTVSSKVSSTSSVNSTASSKVSTVSSVNSTTTSSSVTSSEEETKVPDWKLNPGNYKLIALTFDDAPSHSNANSNSTVTIVKTLNKYEGAGTLFVVGKTLNSKGTSLLRYAVKNGFELGNHTYEHRSVKTDAVGKTWTAEQNRDDFKKCQDLVYQQLGITMKWLRPSGVHTNAAVYQACTELGLPCIIRDTTVATNDWNKATTQQQIEDAVINNAYDGAIVLMHSTNSTTAAALEKICSELYSQGYRFCTLSELFELRGVEYESIPRDKGINGYNPETGYIFKD